MRPGTDAGGQGDDRSRVRVVETWAPDPEPERPQRARGNGVSSQAVAVVVSACILGVLVAPFTFAAERFKEPIEVQASAPGTAVLQARNTSDTGTAARFVCANPKQPCVNVRNPAGGPAAKFVSKTGTPPFEVGQGADKVPNLNADLLDGLSAGTIIERATELAPGAVTGAIVRNGSITEEDLAPEHKDGVPSAPSLRTLGPGATQAAAGNDPRLTNTRDPNPRSVGTAEVAPTPYSIINTSAAQTFPGDGTVTQVNLDTQVEAFAVNFDDTTSRLIIMVEGLYAVTGQIGFIWDGDALIRSSRGVSLVVNGTGTFADEYVGAVPDEEEINVGPPTQIQVNGLVRLHPRDEVTMVASQTAGEDLPTALNDWGRAQMTLRWVGP